MCACAGVAGLDPAGRFATVGREDLVRGVWVAPAADDRSRVHLTLELVGLEGARLPEAGQRARGLATELCGRHDLEAVSVDVRFTDLAPAALPPQRLPEPGPPAAPPPLAAPRPRAVDAPTASAAPAAPPTPTPLGPPVRVTIPEPQGRRTLLVITVEAVPGAEL